MPTEKLVRAVIAYDRGPYQGDWEQACRAAGFTRIPSLTQRRVQEAFSTQGLVAPSSLAEGHLHSITALPTLSLGAVEEPLGSSDAFEIPEPPSDEASEQEWDAFYTNVDRLWYQIGMGVVAADATQRQVLQEIRTRRHGKAGVKEVKEETSLLHHIIVLPALGSGAGATICPNCKKALLDD